MITQKHKVIGNVAELASKIAFNCKNKKKKRSKKKKGIFVFKVRMEKS